MPETLLDTDTLSEIFKRRNARVVARAEQYLRIYPRFTFASVSVVEILSGLYARDARRQIVQAEAFLDAHHQIIPQPDDYKLCAQIIGALKRQGRPIGAEDRLIAACAVNRGMTLATGNVRHYGYVVQAGFEMTVENWNEP